MYHIKNDKRCLRSAALIADALERLLDQKIFADISVSDLQRESGVGRSTFYRLFDNIDDVVTYLVDEKFKDIVAEYNSLSWKDFTAACLEGIIGENEKLINIVTDGRTDLLTRSIRNNLQKIHLHDDPVRIREVSYSFAVFAGSCISMIRSWDENGRIESIDELAEIIERFLDYEQLSIVHPRTVV